MDLINDWEKIDFDKIIELYQSVGWSAYSERPEALKQAFQNSSYIVLAMEDGKLLGLSRSLSDDVAIHYVQDILVSPSFQSCGVGQALLINALHRYTHVRTHLLLTDDDPKQHQFYQKLGFHNLKGIQEPKLNVYLQMEGVDMV